MHFMRVNISLGMTSPVEVPIGARGLRDAGLFGRDGQALIRQ
jgi:hypothetical protein